MKDYTNISIETLLANAQTWERMRNEHKVLGDEIRTLNDTVPTVKDTKRFLSDLNAKLEAWEQKRIECVMLQTSVLNQIAYRDYLRLFNSNNFFTIRIQDATDLDKIYSMQFLIKNELETEKHPVLRRSLVYLLKKAYDKEHEIRITEGAN